MPYLENQQDDEEEQQAPPLQVQAGSAVGAVPAAAVAPAVSPNAGQAPGRYVNFQRYFGANKDAAEAASSRLATGLQTQGEAAKADLAKRQGQFATGVTQGQGLAARGATSPRAATPAATFAAPTTATAARQPVATASNPAGRSPAISTGFAGVATPRGAAPVGVAGQPVQYTGPGALSESAGWQDLVNSASRVGRQVAQTQSPEGLQALFQQANPGGTAGGSRLDAALTNAAAGDRFARLREAFGGLPSQLAEANAASRAAADGARARVGEFNVRVEENAANQRAADERAAAARAAAELAKQKAAGTDPDSLARAQTIKDAIDASYLKNYTTRGKWGITDIFKMGDASAFDTSVEQNYPELGDANVRKAIYEGMTPDEYREFRWLSEINGMTSRGAASTQWQNVQHPDSDGTPAGNKAALRKFLESMKKKYGS